MKATTTTHRPQSQVHLVEEVVRPGILTIDETAYTFSTRTAPEPDGCATATVVLAKYDATTGKETGDRYNVSLLSSGHMDCDCPDFVWRDRSGDEADPDGLCKHCRACRDCGLLDDSIGKHMEDETEAEWLDECYAPLDEWSEFDGQFWEPTTQADYDDAA